MSKAETALASAVFFTIFISLFASSTPQASGVSSTLVNLLSGPPAVNSVLSSCGPGDVACATLNIAKSILIVPLYLVTLLIWAVSKVIYFFSFITVTISGTNAGGGSLTFIGLFWGILFIYVAFEAIRIFRGNSTAGV